MVIYINNNNGNINYDNDKMNYFIWSNVTCINNNNVNIITIIINGILLLIWNKH